jgi:GT2 family glycosyltransferase
VSAVRVVPVSVVIATRERPELLTAAVRSILAGEDLPAEIVVADQSTPPRAALPRSADVEVRHLPLATTGLSRARNAGIAAATHDVLVFTDDDVLVEPDWLARIVAALAAARSRAVVTGAVRAGAVGGHVPSVTSRVEPAVFAGRPFADPLFPNNMALRRSAFDEIGLFDERLGAGAEFPAAEDNDFGYRLLEAGYEIVFVPGAVVHHLNARSGRRLAALDWSYGRGQGAFYAKHMRCSDPHMLRRFGRNAAFRLRRIPLALRGDRTGLREAIYLAGMVSGALQWRRRYGGSP